MKRVDDHRQHTGAGRAGHRPRGAIIVIVLVALVVASAVLMSIVRLAVADRTAWRVESWRIQAAWLAESGLERAAARLQNDSAYQGETWILPAEWFDGRHSGKITIHLSTVAEQPSHRRVRVEADYPDDPQDRARQTRETVLPVSQGESKP